MPAEFESGVFTEGKPAWHGLGTVVEDDALNAQDALRLSGLADWRLTKEPIYVAGETGYGQQHLPVPGFAAVVRGKDGAVLGVVGDRYRIVTNEDAFAWADGLVGGAGCHFKTAGSLYGGSRVWVLLKTPFGAELPDSAIEQYLLLWNRHDGHGTVQAQLTNIRVVCANTLRLADSEAKATGHAFSIRHTRGAEAKLVEAQRVLGLAQGAADRAETLARDLLARQFSLADWAALVNGLMPVPETAAQATVAKANQDLLHGIYFDEPTQQGIKGTAWGALNAVAFYEDHVLEVTARGQLTAGERRMVRVLAVDRPSLTDKAQALLLAR